MQRIAFLIFVATLFTAQTIERRAAGPQKHVDYSKFNHATHKGKVDGVLRKGQEQELTCASCHSTPTIEQPKVTGFPNTKPGSQVTHSACTDCHAMLGREATTTEQTYPRMCLICHASTRLSELKTNVRSFPNLAAGAESQFHDNYSHSDHTGYTDGSALFKERFKDKKKFKERDNFECVACHTVNREAMKVASIDFAAGVKASAPAHAECFVCHFNEKEVPAKRPTFATNCTGCHVLDKKAKGAGSEHAVLWFSREIIAPELNATKPPAKALKPFSHTTHEDAIGADTKSCLECHATGKRAEKRSDFFAADRRTQEKQPRAGNCVECHRKEMQQKIEGTFTLATAKCNYCHALPTIRQRSQGGITLPPPSHFYKKPAPTPAPAAPAPPTGAPVPTPTPTPKPR
ncbi:MAG: cytochrome c3 family protein [Acidobacteriota bacterium]